MQFYLVLKPKFWRLGNLHSHSDQWSKHHPVPFLWQVRPGMNSDALIRRRILGRGWWHLWILPLLPLNSFSLRITQLYIFLSPIFCTWTITPRFFSISSSNNISVNFAPPPTYLLCNPPLHFLRGDQTHIYQIELQKVHIYFCLPKSTRTRKRTKIWHHPSTHTPPT